MRSVFVSALGLAFASLSGCSRVVPVTEPGLASPEQATMAQVYFWRARPERFAEYSRYVRDVAEPIDREAQRRGAFLSVMTYETTDTTVRWTHMRVFLLRDSAQWRGLSAALADAGMRVEPDSVRRREKAAYAATLRESTGATLTRLLR